jgi:flagellar biosynthesis/type III secretory pathway M-ring protein FliF/YscJ
MLGAVQIVRSLLNRMRVRLASLPSAESLAPQPGVAALRAKRDVQSLPPAEEEVNEQTQLRNRRRDRVTGYIRENPNETSRLLKVWLAED